MKISCKIFVGDYSKMAVQGVYCEMFSQKNKDGERYEK